MFCFFRGESGSVRCVKFCVIRLVVLVVVVVLCVKKMFVFVIV